MKHACSSCHQAFEIDADLTLEDMRNQRLVWLRGAYWHIPCARLIRGQGILDVEENGGGKLVPADRPA